MPCELDKDWVKNFKLSQGEVKKFDEEIGQLFFLKLMD